MNYRDAKRKPIHLGEVIGRGGEATIYKITGQPGLLAKIYERPPRNEYARKLLWMRDHPPDDPTAAQQHASLAWPVDLLFASNGQLAGYLMPYIEYAVPLLDVFNPRRCAEVLPDFNRRYLHRAARNLAAALGALHARGYVVGDINESNILVTPRALVTMIDTDSFQVRELTPSGAVIHTCPVARLEYTPPELQGKASQNTARSPEQDAFGLGVLVYQLLVAGNHPFRAQWLGAGEPPPLEERIRQGCFPYRNPPVCPVAPPPGTPGLEELHPAVSRLVLRCFIDGHRNPHRRPTPEQWERAVGEAETNLVLCPNGHYYSNHLSECPLCHPRATGRQIPLPAVANPQTQSHSHASLPASASAARGSRPKTSASRPSASVAVPAASTHAFPARSRLGLGLPGIVLQPFRQLGARFTRRSVRFNRQSLLESFLKGALLGAGAGALGGCSLAALSFGLGQGLRWSPLLTVGAIVGAAWRSLQIGLGLSYQVIRTVGWEAVLKASFALVLVLLGGYTGWLIHPSFQAAGMGGFMGGMGGWLLGDAIWNHSRRIRWDWVGAGAVVALFAWLAYLSGGWIANGWPGQASGRLIGSLAAWADGQNIGRVWISAVVGAVGGGLGGALAGGLTESLAEILGFRK